MSVPYYQSITDVAEYLEHYNAIYSLPYYISKTNSILKLLPPRTYDIIADLGCGGGYYSIAVANKYDVKKIIFCDISKVCVESAKINAAGKTSCLIESFQCSATDTPLKDNSCDLVICSDLIEHLENDALLIDEVYRTLKLGGFLLVSTQNSNSLNYCLEGIIQYLLRNKNWMGWDPTHKRFYTFNKLKHLLLPRFEIQAVSGTYFIPYNLYPFSKSLIHLNKFISNAEDKFPINRLGWGITLLCKKIL
jgi:2-polyprenyl-6-hydroxyphenyl methylase/3-demethylubiquinone-9 3-methyltransferase